MTHLPESKVNPETPDEDEGYTEDSDEQTIKSTVKVKVLKDGGNAVVVKGIDVSLEKGGTTSTLTTNKAGNANFQLVPGEYNLTIASRDSEGNTYTPGDIKDENNQSVSKITVATNKEQHIVFLTAI